MVGIGGRELMGIAVTSYNCLLLPLSVSSSVLLFYSCCPSWWRPWAVALSSKLTPSPKACTLQRNWSLLSLSWTGTTSASLSPIGSSLPGTTPTLLSWSDWRPSERLNDASLVPGSAWKLFECCGWGLGLLVYFVTALAALEWGSCFSFVLFIHVAFFFHEGFSTWEVNLSSAWSYCWQCCWLFWNRFCTFVTVSVCVPPKAWIIYCWRHSHFSIIFVTFPTMEGFTWNRILRYLLLFFALVSASKPLIQNCINVYFDVSSDFCTCTKCCFIILCSRNFMCSWSVCGWVFVSFSLRFSCSGFQDFLFFFLFFSPFGGDMRESEQL